MKFKVYFLRFYNQQIALIQQNDPFAFNPIVGYIHSSYVGMCVLLCSERIV